MNILVVHEAEYREKVIFEYQIIPEILASRGHNLYVIDYHQHWKREHPLDLVQLRTETIRNVKKAGKQKGITLIRPPFIKIPGLSRLTAFIAYFWVIRHTIVQYKIDKIILYAAPTNGLQTIFWAKIYKIPVLFRLLDVLHQLVPNKFLQAPTKLIESIVYRHSDYILAITPRLAKYAKNLSGRNDRIGYLPSGSDADLFKPEPKNKKLMKQYGLHQDDLVLVFAGTLYHFSGLDKLIKLLPEKLKKTPNLKLLIVGHGEQADTLKRLVKKLELEKQVKFTGFINYENLADYINLGDIGINPFEINDVTDIIFPGKIYQYLGCGKPVIATKLKGMTDIFPVNTTNHNIYYMDQTEDIFTLSQKITSENKPFKDDNPSLQQISTDIEALLKGLEVV